MTAKFEKKSPSFCFMLECQILVGDFFKFFVPSQNILILLKPKFGQILATPNKFSIFYENLKFTPDKIRCNILTF